MDLRLVEIFCRVYEEKSFSRAAESLGLTQPTISGHVKALEESLETTLLDRLGRTIAPTAAGRVLYEHGRRIVERKLLAEEAMDRFLNRLEGRLHLGASTIPGEYLLPEIIGRFRDSHPEIRISLSISDTRCVAEQVAAGEIELGFVGGLPEDPRLRFRQVAGDELILVLPTTGDWRRTGDAVSLEELRRIPLLQREEGSGTRMALERAWRSLGQRPEDFDVVAELGSTAAIKEAVRAGLGAAWLSSLSVRSELEVGWLRWVRVRQLEPLSRSFFSVVNRQRAISPLCEALLSFVKPTRQKVA